MPHEPRAKSIASPFTAAPTAGEVAFAGFRPPTSNTTYTPNQFFDVCLPNASRGCVRIVAYLIRRTLGWCDPQGNPQREQIEIGYRELERKAGVGHDRIRDSLDEAVAKHFIECVRAGRASSAGDFGESALYALKWDAAPVYARGLDEFRGFYEGEGHRTDIPNEFFDRIVPAENLSVIRVVGAVIRYSIGFQAKHGRRRQQATLAYSQILKVSGLSSRRTLAGAIREAIDRNYIVRLDAGYFSASVRERRSATYAVRWTDGFHTETSPLTTPERIPARLWITHSEKDTSGRTDRSDPATSTAPERIPADHSGKDTIEMKPLNEKQKQQEAAADLLREEGFDARTAAGLAEKYPLPVIRQQIGWMPLRNATKSRPGLLRRAIEGDWPKPHTATRENTEAKAASPDTPKARHFREFIPAYRDWLAAEERDYRTRRPQDYARFTAKRDRHRRDLLAEQSASVRASLLAGHDTESRRLADFQIFLGLPDFWQWDATINNKPFQS